jgi:hypothetical protein
MRHHRFLPPKHRYHQWRSSFDGMIKNGEVPKHRDGKFIFEMIKNINFIFGKPVKGIKRKKSEKPSKDSPFKKQSSETEWMPTFVWRPAQKFGGKKWCQNNLGSNGRL